MENNRPTLHPAIMIAAASVTALSLAGIGVLTGVVPFGQKNAAPAGAVQMAAMQPAAASALPAAPSAPAAAAPQTPTVAVNVNTTPAPAAARAPAVARSTAPTPVRVVRNQDASDIDVYRYDRPPVQYRTAATMGAPAPAVCHDCGTIESVREIAREPDGSGVGAVAGGVLGGVLGNQVGNGRGRDLATVIGVVGGAVAGNQIEKSQKRVVEYQVTVRFEDGTSRTFTQATPSAWRSGDRVKLENGVLVGRA